jgi:uncharacterized protein with HEPN domain
LSRDERQRLVDLQGAVEAIVAHLARAREENSTDDPMLHDALLFQFVVVGEAVKHLSEETRALAPEVPWRDVAALRDLITHEYFRISIERILQIVDRDLPVLQEVVARLLADPQP